MENTMKIKTKLAISFCIIIFVPVVLTSIVLVGFNKIQLKAINKTYGMEDAGMLALTDTVQFLNKVTGRSRISLVYISTSGCCLSAAFEERFTKNIDAPVTDALVQYPAASSI